MKRAIIVFVFVFLGDSLFVLAAVSSVLISNSNPRQGDTVMIEFPDKNFVPQSVTWNNVAAPVFNYKNSLISVLGVGAAQTPGNYDLQIVFLNGEKITKTIKVLKAKVPLVELPVTKELGQTSEELVSNLAKENADLNQMFSSTTPRLYFNGPFGLPLSDNRRLGSVFGEVRKTGENMIRHLGIDFSAPLGAAVGAINGGIVRKAYDDPIYGKTVILDHGEGIYSMYLHLNEMKVKEGMVLAKGALVGRVGKTGYATAPHLHLSLKIGNISVNPLKFVSVFAAK